MYATDTTQISQTGLRYTSKENGSPFQGRGGSGQALSCIKCGHHKPRSLGIFRRYPTALMFICFDCRPNVAKQ